MFIAREKELKIIENTFENPNTAIAIYGKRRVGKTTLIHKAISDKEGYIYFECQKDTLQTNINSFLTICRIQNIDIPSYATFNSFIDVFMYLNSLNKRLYIVIDEFPYLKTMSDSNIIDSQFQTIIDAYLTNINLVISGSQIKMMENILNNGNPLFGRFTKVIYLREFNYIEARLFYPSCSYYESAKYRAIFGGSPFVNETINDNSSLKENIINSFLDENNKVYHYANNVLITDVSNELQARRVLSFLANTKRKYKDIVDELDPKNTGIINRSLESLVDLNLVKKVIPINKPNDKKKGYYEISDNVLRFFYTYVYKNMNVLKILGADSFCKNYIEPTLTNYISYRFEEQVREYFSLLSIKGIKTNSLNIGTYYYDDAINKTNGEFDIAIKINGGYEIYEAKFYKEPLEEDVMNSEIKQIEQIKELDIKTVGFVNINGFVNNKLPYKQIDGEMLYKLIF